MLYQIAKHFYWGEATHSPVLLAPLPKELWLAKGKHAITGCGALWPVERKDVLENQGVGAGEGDRTLVLSLENSCSTIELHPHTVFGDTMLALHLRKA
jgi:hypothetical protein